MKRVRNAHSTFITGLEFLPTSEASAVIRGFREASVVSISVDHQVRNEAVVTYDVMSYSCLQVCIHHVPELQTVSSVSAMILVILVLVVTFILSSYVGL